MWCSLGCKPSAAPHCLQYSDATEKTYALCWKQVRRWKLSPAMFRSILQSVLNISIYYILYLFILSENGWKNSNIFTNIKQLLCNRLLTNHHLNDHVSLLLLLFALKYNKHDIGFWLRKAHWSLNNTTFR